MTIEVNQLHKTFGSVPALNGMTFTVNPGELYGFVGSNGAGKTTTMRIMLGVLNADYGSVTRDGKALSFADRARFGYMPEERGLYPKMAINDQLIYLARLHRVPVERAKEQVEYWTKKLGIHHRGKENVQNLSLGNQQRVQLCAALIHDPEVLVLDEPFSGLDPLAVEMMGAALREKAAQGTTVIFSSHQLDLVERICDRIGIASMGKIAAEGTPTELRTRNSENLFEIQSPDARATAEAIAALTESVDIIDAHTLRAQLRGNEDQALLHAALAGGPVHSFTRYLPRLSELFGSIVTVPSSETEEATPKKTGLFARLGGRRKK
ncbi:ABC transporter ATP-binding protein [Trueperella sp. LYQ143]|uniref:ABC transporter ATP-binding protein n=1 Tax=unclassified Trueperella TaxID=2630174 RepID=UPI003983C364